jgi:hypothetical protein
MVVLFTGISGLESKTSLENFVKNHKAFKSLDKSKHPYYIKLEAKIESTYKGPKVTGENIWISSILRQAHPALKLNWENALNAVIKEMNEVRKTNPSQLFFINLHACYFHNRTQEYISLINVNKVKEKLNPDFVVTLIDDVYDIYHRLKRPGGLFSREIRTPSSMIMRYVRLLDWRSKEIMMSKFIAQQFSEVDENQIMVKECKHYVFAVKHSFDTLYKLVYEHQNCKRVYLSHAISEVRRLEEAKKDEDVRKIKEEIQEISNNLSDTFTTFLPTTIDEFRINLLEDKENKPPKDYLPVLKPRWESNTSSENSLYNISGFNNVNKLFQHDAIEDKGKRVKELLGALIINIKDQITTRDYSLVEQSDVLVIYRPLYNGNPSGSVQEEFDYYTKVSSFKKNEVLCFIYCPEKDLNAFYPRQFVALLLEHIHNRRGGLNRIEEEVTEFRGITEEESKKLIALVNSKSSLSDYLDSILSKYDLGLFIGEKPASMDANDYEMQRKYMQSILDDLSETYAVVEKYKLSTHFEDTDIGIANFCSIVRNKIQEIH